MGRITYGICEYLNNYHLTKKPMILCYWFSLDALRVPHEKKPKIQNENGEDFLQNQKQKEIKNVSENYACDSFSALVVFTVDCLNWMRTLVMT